MHLCVWDARRAIPELLDVEIADLVHVPINTIVDGMTEDFAKKGKSHRNLYERTIYRRKQLAELALKQSVCKPRGLIFYLLVSVNSLPSI